MGIMVYYGIFLIMGNARFFSSTVVWLVSPGGLFQRWTPRTFIPVLPGKKISGSGQVFGLDHGFRAFCFRF